MSALAEELSILRSVKKVLGIPPDYDAFDVDIVMHINTVFTILESLGVGPEQGFMIIDDTTEWTDYIGSVNRLNAVKSYIYLRVRLLFDPPATSFAIDAMTKQYQELEWRLNVHREEGQWSAGL